MPAKKKTTTTEKPNHFADYTHDRDESWTVRGRAKPAYTSCLRAINSLSKDELQLRQMRLDRAGVELGLHFGFIDPSTGSETAWQLDLFPRILTKEDWSILEAGVLQRAKAFNAYIGDIYNNQDILRDTVIPHHIVLGDPAFQRQFVGMLEPDGQHCVCGAVDVIRDEKGEWQVLENHLATPFGLSFVVQNRRMMAQAFPELFKSINVCPVASFTTQLLEALRSQSNVKRPRIVLLTRGESNQAFFEESFLARHMGIALTRPGDLMVRDGYVYLKTIRGLEQVDVIYRRLESSSIDPVALPQSEFNGVPGLVSCARKGTVQIVNSLGAGIADNRSILRYSDRIISYYLHEKALLKTIDTFHLSDQDQASHVLQKPSHMVFKPIQDHQTMRRYLDGGIPSNAKPGFIHKLARKHPDLFVAQNYIKPTKLPRFDGKKFSGRSVFMRVFFLLGDRPVVLPGGLTRQGIRPHQPNRLTIMSEGMKDTLIPLEASPTLSKRSQRTSLEPRRDFSISSRVAEALYWIGRYMDRAESTSRQINILEDIRWDRLPAAAQQSYWPLWRSVATATGLKDLAARKTPLKDTLRPARILLMDPTQSASVISCVRAARFNAASIRDFFNPETWQVLVELSLYLENELQQNSRLSHTRLVTLTDRVVAEVARLWGTAERTLLHDDGWQFYRIGTFIERAVSNMTLASETLLRTLQTFTEDREEDTDLASLLELLGSLDAYRREYSSRAYIDRVAHILIQSPNNPSSVNFCLKNIRYSLSTLNINGDNSNAKVLAKQVEKLSEYISTLPLSEFFPAPADLLDAGVRAKKTVVRRRRKESAQAFKVIGEELNELHQRIEDAYFSHLGTVTPQRQMRLFS